MKDRDRLLEDVLREAGTDTLREGSLAGMLGAVRRRRRRRVFVRAAGACAAALVLAVATAVFVQDATNQKAVAAMDGRDVITSGGVKVITEEELLALFKGRPVALIGERDNRRFILLDEVGDGPNL
jgi:hypothetical protein